MHLDLQMFVVLETFDQNKINRRQMMQQFSERRLFLFAQFMHQGPALTRRDQDFMRARLPMFETILARLVDIKGVMGVFQR